MTTATPRLSAVLPNYNHGRCIGEAVAALAAQSPAPDEIIIVDDGSTDGSVAVIEQLADRFPMVRLVALDRNIGAIGALNRGLSEAKGAFVYFGAADDVTLPGLFAALLPPLLDNPAIAFASAEGRVEDVDTGASAARPPVRPANVPTVFSTKAVSALFRRMDNWILTGAAVIRKSAMLEAGGFDLALGAAADALLLRRLAFAYGCAYAPHPGLIWRISSAGVSRSQAADPEKNLQALSAAIACMVADPCIPDWYPPLFERRWRFGMGRIAAGDRPMNRAVLQRVAARSAVGRVILGTAARLGGQPGKLLALSWLTLRERPMSLTALAGTWIARRIHRSNAY